MATAITVGPPTGASWFNLTPFEAVFLAIVVLQVSILQSLGIIPIYLNGIFKGVPSGKRRKRRRKRNLQKEEQSNFFLQAIIESKLESSLLMLSELLKSLKKVDKFDCIESTFCVLKDMNLDELLLAQQFSQGSSQQHFVSLSSIFQLIFDKLDNASLELHNSESLMENSTLNFQAPGIHNSNIDSEILLDLNKEKITINSENRNSSSMSTFCEQKYPNCPMKSLEITHHIKQYFMLSNIISN